MNELVQLLKGRDISSKIEESSATSSNSYQKTLMVSFERKYSVVKWPLENSTSNEGTSSVRGNKEEISSIGFFEIREKETSTNKED